MSPMALPLISKIRSLFNGASGRTSETLLFASQSRSKLMRFVRACRSRFGVLGVIPEICKFLRFIKVVNGYRSVIEFRLRLSSLRFVANSKPRMLWIPFSEIFSSCSCSIFSFVRGTFGRSPISPRTAMRNAASGIHASAELVCCAICWIASYLKSVRFSLGIGVKSVIGFPCTHKVRSAVNPESGWRSSMSLYLISKMCRFVNAASGRISEIPLYSRQIYSKLVVCPF